MSLDLRQQVIHAAASEAALIGCAIYDREASQDAFDRLRPEHFGDPVFARLWAYILGVDGFIDPGIMADAFAQDEAFGKLGGIRFLSDVIDAANPLGVPAHVEAVIDAATRRELSSLAREIQNRAQTERGRGEALVGELEQGAAEIARRNVSTPQAQPVGLTAVEMVEAAYNGGFAGIPVGLEALDKVTGGVRQDNVWFIAGRTSMGKSVMGVNLARLIAQQGRGVVFFSLEMPTREVQARLIADQTFERFNPENLRYGDILKGRGSALQRDRAIRGAKALASLPLVVNDRGGLTIEDIRTHALRHIRAWERMGVLPGAIVIDHIGLVKAHTRRGDSKAAETADTVNELKHLAKSIGAPVIVLCQVNRNTESRNDRRPTLADLNWSGAIEQIADMICLLYRESYYLERSASREDQNRVGEVEHDLELLIAKNRSGPVCNLKVFIDVACNAVRDLDVMSEGDRAWR